MLHHPSVPDYGIQFMPVIAPHHHTWRSVAPHTPIPSPGIDLLASAAEYVQREEERLRKRQKPATSPNAMSYYHSIPPPNVT